MHWDHFKTRRANGLLPCKKTILMTDCSDSQQMGLFFFDIFHIFLVNKKSELMLMRRVKAYSSSCSQVILVCLHPFCCNSLYCSKKIAKNH